MKRSFIARIQKEMNRTQMTQIQRINTDLFIKINNYRKIRFVSN